MTTVEQHNESLTMRLAQFAQINESRLGLLGALALTFGKKLPSGVTELRIPKSQVLKLRGHAVKLRSLKQGGFVIEVTPVEPQ